MHAYLYYMLQNKVKVEDNISQTNILSLCQQACYYHQGCPAPASKAH